MFGQDAGTLAIGALAVVIAGLSKGGFGGGAGFVAAPLIALALPPAQAVAVMLPLLMLMDVTGLKAYWGEWDKAEAKVLMLGALPGLALGWAIFAQADGDAIKLLIGALAVGFAIFQIAQSRGWAPSGGGSRRMGYFWGAIAGFVSFVVHAGGPPTAIHLLARGLGKTSYQATTVLFFWAINAIKLLPYAALGLFTPQTLTLSALLAPMAVAGMLLGVWGHHRMPQGAYFLIVRVLLLGTGTKLLWDGVQGWIG